MPGSLKIVWMEDAWDCEDCGYSFESGAVVYLDDKEIIDLAPHAHCYNGCGASAEEVYTAIFEYLTLAMPEVSDDEEGLTDILDNHLNLLGFEVVHETEEED